MEWKDVGKMVGRIAPLLGNALGGPVTGGAISLITSALGLEGDAPPDAVMNAINADPESALKLKTVQEENKATLALINLERDKLGYDDIKDARARQVASETVTGKKDTNLYALAWTIVIGFFGLTGLMIFRALPEASSQAIYMLFGALIGAFGQVGQYFFGSSKSSSDKTKLMVNGK